MIESERHYVNNIINLSRVVLYFRIVLIYLFIFSSSRLLIKRVQKKQE